MNVAIQLIVDIVIADILQGSAAGGTLETLYVQIFILDPYEDASAEKNVRLKDVRLIVLTSAVVSSKYRKKKKGKKKRERGTRYLDEGG